MVYPKRENVVFHSGFDYSEEDEEDNKGPGGSYSFRGSKRAVHRFCKVCGSCVLGDVHADFLAVNVRLPPPPNTFWVSSTRERLYWDFDYVRSG